MPLGWIDTASESEGEIAESASRVPSTFPKDIDFTGTTQQIYNSLMEGILTQPHARNSTMPMERQQTIVFNQPSISFHENMGRCYRRRDITMGRQNRR